MKKKIIKCVSFVLAAVTLVSSVQMTSVFGATKNVIQTRTLADIEDFPTSYRKGLQNVKSAFPNAQFVLYDTGLDWYKDVLTEENEMKYGRNLISSESPASWKQSSKQVEPGWVQASQSIVEHYMDPRNFLNEKDVFQFMSLAYDDNQTVEGTQTILNRTFMASKKIEDLDGNMITYAEAFWRAGKETGVSPYLLACRVRQEQSENSSMISGDFYNLSGYYNYFNIGAYGSTTNKILKNGLTHAKNKGWDTPYKSILGGAEVLSENYIDLGKDCLYLHHFNMIAYDGVVSYSPYMASTLAPYHESKNLANACKNKNAAYVFIIPVYRNMPGGSKLPNATSSDDCLLKQLSITSGDVQLQNFSSYTYKYEITSTEQLQYLTVKAEMNSPASSLSINGMTLMTNGATKVEKVVLLEPGFSELNINVCAENGANKDYVIEVFNNDGEVYYFSDTVKIEESSAVVEKALTVGELVASIEKINCEIKIVDENNEEKGEESLAKTGDMLLINDMSGSQYYAAPIVVKGDIDFNGVLNENDVELIKKHILEINTFTVQELLSADMDNDGVIGVEDLGKIIRNIRGEQKEIKDEVTLTVSSQDDVYFGQKSIVTIDAENLPYVAEGYLTYNEGKLETLGEENSGSVHFITDGSNVMFDNGTNQLLFSSVVRGGTIDLGVLIENAYDFAKEEPMVVYGSTKTINVFDHELSVVVKSNENVLDNDVTYIVENISNSDIQDIEINFGEYLQNQDGENITKLDVLPSGETFEMHLNSIKGLEIGRYSSEIQTKYKNNENTINVIKKTIDFGVNEHVYQRTQMEYDENVHYIKCVNGDDVKAEQHKLYQLNENMYKCAMCDFSKTVTMTIVESNIDGVVYTPVVSIDGEKVSLLDKNVNWYIGTEIKNGKFLKQEENRLIQENAICVVDLGNDIVVYDVVELKNNQIQNDNIFVDKITCDSVVFRKGINHEYKLDDGEWSKNNIFENLVPNSTHVVSHRMVGSDKITKAEFTLSHLSDDYTNTHKCGQDMILVSDCKMCKNEFSTVIKGVEQNCIFVDFETIEKATCNRPSKEIARCIFECGNTKEKSITPAHSHIFTNYQTDNNATCKNYGTATAECSFGCGKTNSLIVESSSTGHEYEYKKISEPSAINSGRELGICKHCGKENIRTVDKTRLQMLANVYIKLSNAKAQSGLPEVSVNEKYVSIEEIVWKNEYEAKLSELISLKSGETYRLATLKLKVVDGYAISKSTNVYVNGKLYSGSFSVVNGIAEFTELGQFKL